MGAHTIRNVELGRDASQAFRSAQDADLYEYGHDPYSGTLGAKHGFVEFPALRGRMSLDRLERLASDASYYEGEKQTAKQRDALAALAKWAGGEREARRFLETYDDKWAPACCVEVTGQAAVEAKKRRGRAGTRDRVFAFVGFAPS